MGFGLIMPVMPKLIEEVAGTDIGGAAIWGGVLAAAFSAMQFLFSPTVGNISDRFGRRPVLLVSLFVMLLDYIVMGFAHTIWLLLATRLIAGITAATHSTAAAYIADVSRPEDKAKNFGLMGAAFGIGFIFGPVLGGVLGEFGTRMPFFAAAVLAGLNLTFGALILPETVKPENRRAFSWRRANPLGAFRSIGALPGVRLLLAFAFVMTLAGMVYPSIWAFYGAAAFGWSAGTIGLSLAVYGVAAALMQGVAIRPLLSRLGEARTALLGTLVSILTFVLLGLLKTGWLVIALTPISAIGGIAGPAVMALMSHRVADDAQGELQGVITSMNALAMVIAPLALTRIFALFTAPEAPVFAPGAPFLVSAVLVVLSVPIFLAATRRDAP